MARVAVVYHSVEGHTRRLAESIAIGAGRESGSSVELVPVCELPAPRSAAPEPERWPALNLADAIIFGAPTFMGSPSAEFKRFMEASSGIWSRQLWKDKLAGGFTTAAQASGDQLNSIMDLVAFAGQHGMIWVSPGVMPTFLGGEPGGLNRAGAWLGVTAETGDAPATAMDPSDLATAERFGERVAACADRWTRRST